MRQASELRVLVVEDTARKMEVIVSALMDRKVGGDDVDIQIETATCYSEAQSLLEKKYFDIIILDLKIPIVPGGEERLENAKALYDFVRKGTALSKPFYIVGLTSVKEEEVSKVFEENANFSIHQFDDEGQWLEKLSSRIEFVVGAKAGLLSYLSNNSGIDVIVVTARRRNEFDPIVDAIQWVGKFHRPRPALGGMANEFGFVRLNEETEVSLGIVCLDEMGLSHASAIVANLISMFRPRHLAMLGMCCGLQKMPHPENARQGMKCKLGDVVVATGTCCWDEGKYEDSDPVLTTSPFFNNRAVTKLPDREFWRSVDRYLDKEQDDIEAEIADFYRSQDLGAVQKKLIGDVKFSPDATLHWGLIVSGACVIDSGDMIDAISKRFPSAIALEMEAHSVYAAADCCTGLRPKTLVIKGVADFGDGTKAKPVQAMASIGSYIAYLKILQSEYSPKN